MSRRGDSALLYGAALAQKWPEAAGEPPYLTINDPRVLSLNHPLAWDFKPSDNQLVNVWIDRDTSDQTLRVRINAINAAIKNPRNITEWMLSSPPLEKKDMQSQFDCGPQVTSRREDDQNDFDIPLVDFDEPAASQAFSNEMGSRGPLPKIPSESSPAHILTTGSPNKQYDDIAEDLTNAFIRLGVDPAEIVITHANPMGREKRKIGNAGTKALEFRIDEFNDLLMTDTENILYEARRTPESTNSYRSCMEETAISLIGLSSSWSKTMTSQSFVTSSGTDRTILSVGKTTSRKHSTKDGTKEDNETAQAQYEETGTDALNSW
ncbi:hypothetical protein GQ53DRAFT_885940 [Thozetella sp. PMI_491]|nr:hypothetical protein GQ53DRAFT_885940 [Thozetella sp. PMI_491]